MSTPSFMSRCNKWAESLSWLKVEERGGNVVLVCTTCPFNSAWAKGKVVKATTQRSELVHHLESAQHRKGMTLVAQHPILHGLRTMTTQAAAKEAAAAEQAALLSYASWPLHVAKVAHAINKRALPFSVMGDLCTIVQ